MQGRPVAENDGYQRREVAGESDEQGDEPKRADVGRPGYGAHQYGCGLWVVSTREYRRRVERAEQSIDGNCCGRCAQRPGSYRNEAEAPDTFDRMLTKRRGRIH